MEREREANGAALKERTLVAWKLRGAMREAFLPVNPLFMA